MTENRLARPREPRRTRLRPGAFRSVFESKSKAPKTPPSHGLTGFVAIKPVAKLAMVSWPGRWRNRFVGGRQAGSEYRRGFDAGSTRVRRGFGADSGAQWTLSEPGPPRLASGKALKSREPAKTAMKRPCSKPVLLCFREQIQGPENASIARFDGLCCYQTGSEISDGFVAGAVAKPLCGRASGGF